MSARTDLSLSFLDLVTCGFGGVTLLFLILLAVQGQLVEIAPAAAEGDQKRLVSPWLVVLEAEPDMNGSLWLDPSRDPWQVTAERGVTARTGFGPRQAVIVLPKSPGSKFEARLGPFDPEAKFRVRFVSGGQPRTFENQSLSAWNIDGQGNLPIWPGMLSRVAEKRTP